MISLQFHISPITEPVNQYFTHVSMIMRHYHCLRKHIPSPPHTDYPKRISIQYDSVYYLRGILLLWIPELGSCWSPAGIIPLNPLEVPLLNTSVLLASGVSNTWAHHSLMEGNHKHMLQALFIINALGIYFTFLQASEYYETSFTTSDRVYSSTFFMATGFRGLHIIIRFTFLTICFLQLKFHFTSSQHFRFEATAWYWHFFDVASSVCP